MEAWNKYFFSDIKDRKYKIFEKKLTLFIWNPFEPIQSLDVDSLIDWEHL